MNLKNLPEEFVERLLERLFEAAYVTDRSRRILFWNMAAEELTGFSGRDIVGSRCCDNILVHNNAEGRNLCRDACPLAGAMETGREAEAEMYLHHRDGHRLPVHVRILPLAGEDGEIAGAAELFTVKNQSELMKERIDELSRLAMTDPLTSIPNRRYAEKFISERIEEMHRFGWRFGALFVDVDHFKKFNDLYGHAMGDTVLRTVAGTLRSNVRSFDLAARWGGEEFIVVLVNTDAAVLERKAESLRRLIEASFIVLGSAKISVTASIGATLARPEDGYAQIIERADALMYRSKAEGRNRLTVG